MSKTARLFEVLALLRRLSPPVRADDLSREVGVTARTIYRDIEELRGLGVIIEGEAGFGYMLVEDNTLPPQAFETEELEAILLGLKEVRVRADGALARAADAAFAKLRARLPERQRAYLLDDVLASHRFRSEPSITINEPELRDAIRAERRLFLHYEDAAGSVTEREVDPLIVLYLDEVRCLLAHCHLRGDFRSFRIDRIARMDVLKVSFRPRRRGMLRAYMARLRAERSSDDP
ncbi:helix-turn-helix transcriptional regulator [Roseobacteraceae bacterium S113]